MTSLRSMSASVEDVEGETHVLWHGTTTESALAIVRSQHFIPSYGLLGDGVYLAPCQAKAEQYRRGADDGVLLMCRARIGLVSRIIPGQKDSDFIMGGWHETIAPGNATVYNSAWAREGLTNDDGVISTRDGKHEEYCIANPRRIDEIVIYEASDAAKAWIAAQEGMPVEELQWPFGREFWPPRVGGGGGGDAAASGDGNAQPNVDRLLLYGKGYAWVWLGDGDGDQAENWVAYNGAEAPVLHQATLATPNVIINDTYGVDLTDPLRMEQYRRDDETRRRCVQLLLLKESTCSKFKTKEIKAALHQRNVDSRMIASMVEKPELVRTLASSAPFLSDKSIAAVKATLVRGGAATLQQCQACIERSDLVALYTAWFGRN